MQNQKSSFRTASVVAAVAMLFPLIFNLGCSGSSDNSGNTTPATSPGAGTGVGGSGRGPAPVNLATAANFRILAQTTITSVPSSDIVGNVGLSPGAGSALVFSCTEVTGLVYDVDGAGPPCITTDSTLLGIAIGDRNAAYTAAAGRAADYTEYAAGNLGGRNLGPATYYWSSAVIIPSTLTLTGGANDVWIFQIAQTLDLSSGVQIVLAGGALAENIYWQVGSSVALNSGSVFKGTIISQTQIAMLTGASINGRLLAGSQVTLQQNPVKP